jgi:hypothetical protein
LPEFPAKEAMFFVELSDRLFGSKLLSWRRLLCCFGIVLSCFVVFSVMGFATYGTPFLDWHVDWTLGRQLTWTYYPISLGVSAAFFALSLSLTRWISVRVIALANRWKLGLLPYVVLLGVHLILLMYWRPFMGYIQFSIANRQTSMDALLQMARMILVHTEFHFPPMAPPPKLESAPVWTDALVAFASNALRICIALGILSAFIFRKWISGFVDLIKRRLAEEKIPRPFAMILGALGAVAAALKEIASHFSGGPPIH